MFLKDLSRLSLQGLRVFSYVSSLGSVQEAAEALSLTQPAVSLQIHNLEKEIGFQLFERKGRKNVLTTRGQHLFEKLLPQLEKLERIVRDSQEVEHVAKPKISIGSVEGVGEYWLWKRFNEFSKDNDEIRLFLDIDEPSSLEEKLLAGRLSFIISTRRFDNPRIISQFLMNERLLPVGRKRAIQDLKTNFEEAEDDSRAWEKIHWIGYGDSLSYDQWTQRWLEQAGLTLDRRFKYRHEANSYSVIKQLLLEGKGICVAPEHTCEEELKDGSLVSFESKKFPALKNGLYVSFREKSLTAVNHDFKEWLLKSATVKNTKTPSK